MTLRDLSEKDVIQLKTGENLGRIDDLAFEDGQITQVVPVSYTHLTLPTNARE